MSHVKKMIAKKMLYYFWDKKELYNETFRKIQKLNDKFDHDSLQYIQKNGKKTDFSNIPNRITIFNRIKNSEITLEEAKRFREISIELWEVLEKEVENLNNIKKH